MGVAFIGALATASWQSNVMKHVLHLTTLSLMMLEIQAASKDSALFLLPDGRLHMLYQNLLGDGRSLRMPDKCCCAMQNHSQTENILIVDNLWILLRTTMVEIPTSMTLPPGTIRSNCGGQMEARQSVMPLPR